jgi:uncharacterized membrane protein (UPF0127 family)
MTENGTAWSRLRSWFSPRSGQETYTRMKVENQTRKTVLANSVEVADTGPKRNKGLLGRKGLAPGTGLWILPCESVHTFWMQFPLDLVYLDRGLRIRKIRTNVGPWRMSACLSAHSVIELGAGTVGGTQSQPGDQLEFSPVAQDETP